MAIKHELNYDPFLKEYHDKISQISNERLENLRWFNNLNSKNIQLNVIKKVKIKPNKGDVFLVEPIEGQYYYGLVLENNIFSNFSWINGTNIIVIFNSDTKELNCKEYNPNFNNLLVNISFVDDFYWEKGYFYKVGEDCNSSVNYGFFEFYDDKESGYFVDYNGRNLAYIPEIYNILAITTGIGIAIEMLMNLYVSGKNEKINKFIDREIKLAKKNKNFLKYIETEDYCGVSIDTNTEKINKLSKYISKKNNMEILFNGYTLELLIENILKIEKPELIDGLETDPEANLYFAYYISSKNSVKKCKELFKTIKKYIENQSKLNSFIQKHKSSIKFE